MFKYLNLKTIFAVSLLFLSLITFNLYLLTALPAHAQPSLSSTIDCDPALPPSDPKSCNIPAFIKFLKNLINYAVGISIPLATGFIVYGAFEIMTAGGNSGKVDSGKKIIYAAVIGVAIAMGSWLIIKAIINLIPTTTTYIQ
ncbi:MAG: Uncharacterized protein G01um10143_400 [Parcubacteria group bacterium Gr01-1014_3]|nr:MAG: Uncharacterized protein G01um10143_400 [Parcubacteria group bacterium Gr01-1014_3]